MVVFNECRISDDGGCLVIDVSIDNLSYFNNCYIEGIFIDTDETLTPNGPSENAISVDFDRDYCECTIESGMVKSVRAFLRARDLNLGSLDNNIFFIYVKGGGYPDPGSPCGTDKEWHNCVTVDYKPLYDNAMYYVKEVADSCTIPRNFIDMILKLKAINVSLTTGNYPMAIRLWKQWKSTGRAQASSSNRCGCNG